MPINSSVLWKNNLGLSALFKLKTVNTQSAKCLKMKTHKDRKKRREVFCPLLTLQMPATVKDGPGWRHKIGTQWSAPMWWAQILVLSPPASHCTCWQETESEWELGPSDFGIHKGDPSGNLPSSAGAPDWSSQFFVKDVHSHHLLCIVCSDSLVIENIQFLQNSFARIVFKTWRCYFDPS